MSGATHTGAASDVEAEQSARLGRQFDAISRTARAVADASRIVRSLRAAGIPTRGLVISPLGYSREAVEAISRRQAPFLAAARRGAERAIPLPAPGEVRTIGPTLDETNPAIILED